MNTLTSKAVDTQLSAVRSKIRLHEEAMTRMLLPVMNTPEYQAHLKSMGQLKSHAVSLRKIRDALRPSERDAMKTVAQMVNTEYLETLMSPSILV